MNTTTIERLSALLGGGSAKLEATVAVVHELCAHEGPIDEPSMRKLLLAVRDDYPNIEVLGSLLGRLEIEAAWVGALFHGATALAVSAPEIFNSRVARALNDPECRARLVALVASDRAANAEVVLQAADELARSPRPRPGDSARAFLAEVGRL